MTHEEPARTCENITGIHTFHQKKLMLEPVLMVKTIKHIEQHWLSMLSKKNILKIHSI